MTNIDKTKKYVEYAYNVLEGNTIACENIKLACKRFLSWFERDDYWFDYEKVDKMIRFIYLLKHVEGDHKGKHFELLDWQSFVVANIYGWKRVKDNLRVITEAFIFVSRKNGKTALAAALALCQLIADDEGGAEVDFIANSRQQAKIGFDQTLNFTQSIDPKRKYIKTTLSSIKVPKTHSKIQVFASDATTLDGFNASTFIQDEIHAAKDYEMYNIMRSSQQMRSQPLGIIITTAGYLIGPYPCYEMYNLGKSVLRGNIIQDNKFYAIFELDEDDDWQDETNWVKCCPSLHQTVNIDRLREEVQDAINNPSKLVGVLTKNFNKFCQSENVWIPNDHIEAVSANIDLEQLKDEECFLGTDLSAVSDLTATAIMFPPNPDRQYYPDKYLFKVLAYLPEQALQEVHNRELYRKWRQQGYLQITSGNVVDYDYILKDQVMIYRNHYMVNLAYDKWNATSWAIDATEEGLPIEPYSQALGNFNKPTKELERLIRTKRVIIDNNPLIRWSFGNCELKIDHNENVKPIKAGNDQNKKIDPVIAMLQALGGYLDNPRYGDGQVLEV